MSKEDEDSPGFEIALISTDVEMERASEEESSGRAVKIDIEEYIVGEGRWRI